METLGPAAGDAGTRKRGWEKRRRGGRGAGVPLKDPCPGGALPSSGEGHGGRIMNLCRGGLNRED